MTSNGEPPPESGFDFWPTAVWLGAGGGVAVSIVMPCCVVEGSCIDWLGELATELEGVLCALLVGWVLDDCACCVVDATADVLDVANVLCA